MKNFITTFSKCILFVLTFAVSLTAQWSTNSAINNAICTATGTQNVSGIISDGAGGTIIVWEDLRGANYDIYAQKINAAGIIQWANNGVAVCNVAGDQVGPSIVSDGAGGAYIAWVDRRIIDSLDIYVQKINAAGVVQWATDGVVLCSAARDQFQVTGVSDGNGGAIFTWSDYRSNVFFDIYAQRINAFGTFWTANGVAVCTATNEQMYPKIIADGAGGAIVTWSDWRSGTNIDIYAQKINKNGIVQWLVDGLAISTAVSNQSDPAIISNGSGGAIISWNDARNGVDVDIYAQKVDATGSGLWVANGVLLCAAIGDQLAPTIVSDGAGGAVVSWIDRRNGPNDGIYAQKVNESGLVQWATDGVVLCAAPDSKSGAVSSSDGHGGAIVSWQDRRSGTNDVYAQKITGSGKLQWTLNGIAVSSSLKNQLNPLIISDGLGGAMVTWSDQRNSILWDIYAQRIDTYGFLGKAEPKLVAAKDIANDQGGKLRLFWDPSYLDADSSHAVKSYAILRGTKPNGTLGKVSKVAESGIYWEEAGIVKANQLEGYTTVVSTYADSGLQGAPKYYFQVIARNGDSTQTWYSNIDSGYSVDNVPPVGVSGAAINGGQNSLVYLQWNKDVVDPDIMGYYVYRSSTAGFSPNGTTLLALTSENFYTDTSKLNNQKYYYRVAAVDMHGNAGPASTELQVTVLAVGEDGEVIPQEFSLEQNYPNPFNPSTVISYQLPISSHITLKVYDAIGREVVTLVNEVKEAGSYSVQFDASKLSSGIYLARLQGSNEVQLKKMTLMK